MPDDLAAPARRHKTACPHDCPSACALEVDLPAPDRVGRLRGNPDNGYTAGVICAKVARYAERAHHPDRLLRPLRRTGAKGEGRFVPVSWDEALDEVAERFADVTRRHGPEAVFPYVFAGTMGLVQQGATDRLRNVMGYSRQYSTICSTLARTGYAAGTGACRGVDPREMAESELIVVWGTNPVATQVNVMTLIAAARKARGARLIVVDPYRTGTAAQADQHLCLRPGTDAALACAVMHVLFRDGLADLDYLDRYTDDWRALREHVATRGPAWAAAITGLGTEEIEAFAHAYGGTRKSFLRLGYGFSRSRNGAVAMHAATCLPAVTGAWAARGGGALFANWDLYAEDTRLTEASDRADPGRRRMDMSRLGPILTGNRADLGDGPPVMAMIVQNTNPAAVCPESGLVARGLAREDLFLCVHEQFMTDTARYADILLPATTFLEHDDLYVGGGHTHVLAGPKAMEPPGECRSNHDLIRALGRRLGGEHPSFGMTAREIADETARRSGWGSFEAIAQRGWIDRALPFETAHFLDGFPTPTRRFRFRADWEQFGPEGRGMPGLPDQWDAIDAATPDKPFRLVTAPARQFLNSSFTEMPTSIKREGRPTALLHPEDYAALGVGPAGLVRLGNERGDLAIHAQAFRGLQRGVVVVESVWPNSAFREGMGINLLTGADAARPRGGAAFHDTAVWIRASGTEG